MTCKIHSVAVHDENKVFIKTLYFKDIIFEKSCKLEYVSDSGEIFNAEEYIIEHHPESNPLGNIIYNAYYQPCGHKACKPGCSFTSYCLMHKVGCCCWGKCSEGICMSDICCNCLKKPASEMTPDERRQHNMPTAQ